jgi:hypothetical protein
MKFANPYVVDCPSCQRSGNYTPRDLVALRALCQHCSASLDSIGRDMRSQVAEWTAYVAKIEMAIELERMFGVQISDAEIDSLRRPSDFASLLRGAPRHRPIEASILAALGLWRGAPVEARDLQRSFTELFPIEDVT